MNMGWNDIKEELSMIRDGHSDICDLLYDTGKEYCYPPEGLEHTSVKIQISKTEFVLYNLPFEVPDSFIGDNTKLTESLSREWIGLFYRLDFILENSHGEKVSGGYRQPFFVRYPSMPT